MENIRLRFAPSPTGPLHIGGVRTALYNYLFAKKHNGTFILRIEDTDQNRNVVGAESYIIEALEWCGISFDEGPHIGGNFQPYRQSDRKKIYLQYAKQLVENGFAYYAFDTAEELDEMRKTMEDKGIQGAKYNYETRAMMKNSLTLDPGESQRLLTKGENVTVRLLIPKDEDIVIEDLIRGEVTFNSNELDDKIILKADGMPTYHLANVVDDHLMKISHVIRGEEWLSSTAHHLLLYAFFGWKPPFFAHLPLILKPSGKGKLSKRDGAVFGFPVFPLEWKPENEEEHFSGFREEGFLPEALVNFLAFLGWNPGDEREIFSLNELINVFSIEKIVKSGARFDFDKAKWYNQQYIIAENNEKLAVMIQPQLEAKGMYFDIKYIERFAGLMKERVVNISEFLESAGYFFNRPAEYDEKIISKKYKPENKVAFEEIAQLLKENDHLHMGETIKSWISNHGYKLGDILPVLRLAVTGGTQGPDLFDMIHLIGNQECAARIKLFLERV